MILRRFATAAAGAALLTTALAAPASAAKGGIVADHDGPQLLGDRQISVTRGSEKWINLGWTADVELTDFSMTAVPSTDNATVGYPDRDGDGNYDASSSLYWDDILSAGELETAAFMLTTTVETPTVFKIDIYASWTDESGAHSEKIDTLQVRTSNYRGDDYELVDSDATVFSGGDGANNWVEIDFLGVAPLTTDLQVTVTSGLDEVYYPQETYTSLHHDDRLDEGEEDVARFWIDPASVTPGTYEVEIEITFTDHEGKKGKTKHDLTVTVLAFELES